MDAKLGAMRAFCPLEIPIQRESPYFQRYETGILPIFEIYRNRRRYLASRMRK